MQTYEVECFSPPGPGQCQYVPPHPPHHPPHQVDEPGVFILLGLAGAIAYLFRRKK